MTSSRASTPGVAQPAGKIVLLGQPCSNTSTARAVLQDAGIHLAAVILADAEVEPAIVVPEPGRSSGIAATSPGASTRLLERLQPDLVIAACYPWRLSNRARAASRCGVLNIHPSLLPQGRGPDPVFWMYRHGARDAGVTVHLMDGGLDSGPILAQQRIPVTEEQDAVTLEQLLFETGARILTSLIPQIMAGHAEVTPQDDLAATYQPAPAMRDWIISPLLPAAWAWRFVRGVAPLHGPLMVQTQGELVPVRRAVAWSEHGDPPDRLPTGAIPVRFRPGWVVFE